MGEVRKPWAALGGRGPGWREGSEQSALRRPQRGGLKGDFDSHCCGAELAASDGQVVVIAAAACHLGERGGGKRNNMSKARQGTLLTAGSLRAATATCVQQGQRRLTAFLHVLHLGTLHCRMEFSGSWCERMRTWVPSRPSRAAGRRRPVLGLLSAANPKASARCPACIHWQGSSLQGSSLQG